MRVFSIFVALGAVCGLFVYNACMVGESNQLPLSSLPKQRILADFDINAAAARFSKMLAVPSVSLTSKSVHEPHNFLTLHALYEQLYPKLHKTLRKEIVSTYSLLYEWTGSDSSLMPVLLLSHMDVVPVDNKTIGLWDVPPFSGQIMNDYIYGRGAQDVKGTTLCFMEAIEVLIANGHKPRRTIYLSIGHDEEVGGRDGAKKVVEILHSRGVTLDIVLDEGGVPIVDSPISPGRTLAMVGVSEKGCVNIEISLNHTGACHAAMPEWPTPAGKLAAAIVRLEANQMPANLHHFVMTTDFLLPEMSFPMRLVFANRHLFGPLLAYALSFDPKINAFLRTTTATTMMSGSAKRNVIPTRPSANINMRIIPGDTIASTLEHVQRVVGEHVTAALEATEPNEEPSEVTAYNDEQFAALHKSIREAMPDALVAPAIVIARTDSTHFTPIAKHVFRFLPFRMTTEDINRMHGINERVHLDHLMEGIVFYHQFLLNSA